MVPPKRNYWTKGHIRRPGPDRPGIKARIVRGRSSRVASGHDMAVRYARRRPIPTAMSAPHPSPPRMMTRPFLTIVPRRWNYLKTSLGEREIAEADLERHARRKRFLRAGCRAAGRALGG